MQLFLEQRLLNQKCGQVSRSRVLRLRPLRKERVLKLFYFVYTVQRFSSKILALEKYIFLY